MILAIFTATCIAILLYQQWEIWHQEHDDDDND